VFSLSLGVCRVRSGARMRKPLRAYSRPILMLNRAIEQRALDFQ
jgi:hypothetical protein